MPSSLTGLVLFVEVLMIRYYESRWVTYSRFFRSLFPQLMNKITNPRPVAVLMATYNGEKYLRAQIDSILSQTFYDWTLFIQDDGSTDTTVDIIHSYQDPRIVLVDLGLSHQGAGMNFMSLLNVVESQYYMFSDQDDVWFADKMEKTYSRMYQEEEKAPRKPVLVHTSRTITDSQLNVLRQSEFNPKQHSDVLVLKKIEKLKDPHIVAIYSIAGGNTMMINHELKQAVFPFCNVRFHDSVCAMAVTRAGGVWSTILEPSLFYRQHATNTVGVKTNTRIGHKLIHLQDSYRRNIRGYYIYKIYGYKGGFFTFLYYRIKYFMILRS